jgi:ABC-type sugar transport system ATPase subunit
MPLTGGVRPEAIALVTDDPQAMRATVAHVELLGHETLIHCDVGDVRLVVRAAGMVPLSPGDRVHLRIDPARLHFFDAPS